MGDDLLDKLNVRPNDLTTATEQLYPNDLDKINNIYVDLSSASPRWSSEIGKVRRYMDNIKSKPQEDWDSPEERNFWILGRIGSGKTTLTLKEIFLRENEFSDFVFSRWSFNQPGDKSKQLVNWIDFLKDHILNKLKESDKDEPFRKHMRELRQEYFGGAQTMGVDSEELIQKQMEYLKSILEKAMDLGVEGFVIVIDEWDLMDQKGKIGTAEQRKMVQLLQHEICNNLLNGDYPVHLINILTVRILRNIAKRHEAYIERAVKNGVSGVDNYRENEFIAEVFDNLERDEVKKILEDWTGDEKLYPLKESFIPPFLRLTGRKFRLLTWAYREAVRKLDEENTDFNLNIAKEVFSKRVNEKKIQEDLIERTVELLKESNSTIEEGSVESVLDVIFYGEKEGYTSTEMANRTDIEENKANNIFAKLGELGFGSKDPSTGKFRAEVDEYRTSRETPQIEREDKEIRNTISRYCSKHSKSSSEKMRLLEDFFVERLLEADGYASEDSLDIFGKGKKFKVQDVQKLEEDGAFKANIYSKNKFKGKTLEIPTRCLFLVDPDFRGKSSNHLDKVKNIYQKLGSDYEIGYFITKSKPKRRKGSITAFLDEEDENYRFCKKGDRLYRIFLKDEETPDLKIKENETLSWRGPKNRLHKFIPALAEGLPESTEKRWPELSRKLYELNSRELWKKMDIKKPLVRFKNKILLLNLYEKVFRKAKRETDSDLDIFNDVLLEISEREISEEPEEVFAQLNEDIEELRILGSDDFENLMVPKTAKGISSLQNWSMINEVDSEISVPSYPTPLERHLVNYVGDDGQTTLDIFWHVFNIDITESEAKDVDEGGLWDFLLSLLTYMKERGFLTREEDSWYDASNPLNRVKQFREKVREEKNKFSILEKNEESIKNSVDELGINLSLPDFSEKEQLKEIIEKVGEKEEELEEYEEIPEAAEPNLEKYEKTLKKASREIKTFTNELKDEVSDLKIYKFNEFPLEKKITKPLTDPLQDLEELSEKEQNSKYELFLETMEDVKRTVLNKKSEINSRNDEISTRKKELRESKEQTNELGLENLINILGRMADLSSWEKENRKNFETIKSRITQFYSTEKVNIDSTLQRIDRNLKSVDVEGKDWKPRLEKLKRKWNSHNQENKLDANNIREFLEEEKIFDPALIGLLKIKYDINNLDSELQERILEKAKSKTLERAQKLEAKISNSTNIVDNLPETYEETLAILEDQIEEAAELSELEDIQSQLEDMEKEINELVKKELSSGEDGIWETITGSGPLTEEEIRTKTELGEEKIREHLDDLSTLELIERKWDEAVG